MERNSNSNNNKKHKFIAYYSYPWHIGINTLHQMDFTAS